MSGKKKRWGVSAAGKAQTHETVTIAQQIRILTLLPISSGILRIAERGSSAIRNRPLVCPSVLISALTTGKYAKGDRQN